MEHFISLNDIKAPEQLLKKALNYQQHPLADHSLGKHKTLGLLFFNSSLRTRLSMQKAAANLGLNCLVLNVEKDSWQLEFEDGVIMNANKAEHIKEAAAVISQYCDLLGIRAFAQLDSKEKDYAETIINAFKTYASIPIINMESATLHPLQSLADWMTIEDNKPIHRPKIVLSWAPHPRALPQAVANSFLEWGQVMDADIVVTHPKGYELSEQFATNYTIEYDQTKALKDADFVYVKNWSSFKAYGQVLNTSSEWTIDAKKMAITNKGKFMHCLPIRRNVVATDAVLDAPTALCIQQAHNRVPAAQAVLAELLVQQEKQSNASAYNL